MLDYLEHLQQTLVKEFYQLYDRYQDDHIYACSLVFDEFLLLDDLAISTERSIFQDPEDHSNIWPNGIAGMYENGAIKAKALHNLNSCLLKLCWQSILKPSIVLAILS